MFELLGKLGDTPVPNVLIIAGVVFLLLAVAGRIGANLSVPPHRQMAAASIGGLLLVSGIALVILSPSKGLTKPAESADTGAESRSTEAHDKSAPDRRQGSTNDKKIVLAAIRAAIEQAALQEMRADFWLDIKLMNGVAADGYLRRMTARIEEFARTKQFEDCRQPTREIHEIVIEPDGHRATADITETWNCAAYSTTSGDCFAQYVQPTPLRQTLFLEGRTAGWVVLEITQATENTGAEWVDCTDDWAKHVDR